MKSFSHHCWTPPNGTYREMPKTAKDFDVRKIAAAIDKHENFRPLQTCRPPIPCLPNGIMFWGLRFGAGVSGFRGQHF